MKIGIVLITMSRKRSGVFTTNADMLTFTCESELDEAEIAFVIEDAIEFIESEYPDYTDFKGTVKYVSDNMIEVIC